MGDRVQIVINLCKNFAKNCDRLYRIVNIYKANSVELQECLCFYRLAVGLTPGNPSYC
ncbi:hypothetical protein CKA32_006628 [Geitlerinema sp. FC II]|nr:hypothetical protein CKA32_006628 [Geitlerinema sp. FC II]